MAFFGLTALGMQNPFAASADVINHYTVRPVRALPQTVDGTQKLAAGRTG